MWSCVVLYRPERTTAGGPLRQRCRHAVANHGAGMACVGRVLEILGRDEMRGRRASEGLEVSPSRNGGR